MELFNRMTLFIAALELQYQECEKHDLSCLVSNLQSAETPAWANGNKSCSHRDWMLQKNLFWPINTTAHSEGQVCLFWSGNKPITCPLSSQADAISF